MPQAGLGPAAAPHPPALVAQGLARLEAGQRGRNPAQAEEPCTYVPPFLDPPPPKEKSDARGVSYGKGKCPGTESLATLRKISKQKEGRHASTGAPFTAR